MNEVFGAALDVAINGWFAGDPTSGSGQYTDHLLAHLPAAAPAVRFSLLLPSSHGARSADLESRWPGVDPIFLPLPPLPRHLAKLWWEQVAVPRAARRLGAGVLWVPYWAAPYWQPVPTVVTIHDLIPLLIAGLSGRLLAAGLYAPGQPHKPARGRRHHRQPRQCRVTS